MRWNHDWAGLLLQLVAVTQSAQRASAASPQNLTPETRVADLFPVCDMEVVARSLSETLQVLISSFGSFETVQDLMDEIVLQAVGGSQEDVIREFFEFQWTPPPDSIAFKEKLSRILVDTQSKSILDIGCGDNYFKSRFPQVVGVDIANPAADFKCDILEFDAGGATFDAILALGSINFGGRRRILSTLRHIRGILAPEGVIYMRVNPGVPWLTERQLVIYPWSEAKIHDHGREAGLKLLGKVGVELTPNGKRISFKYVHE